MKTHRRNVNSRNTTRTSSRNDIPFYIRETVRKSVEGSCSHLEYSPVEDDRPEHHTLYVSENNVEISAIIKK